MHDTVMQVPTVMTNDNRKWLSSNWWKQKKDKKSKVVYGIRQFVFLNAGGKAVRKVTESQNVLQNYIKILPIVPR